MPRFKKYKPGDSIEIVGAGLILLHPFLQPFFHRLGLTNNNRFNDTKSRDKAVVILSFIASGNGLYKKAHLILPKLLCGVAMNESIKSGVTLNDTIKTESTILLETIIRHWGALKNTSVEGFRESFLNRKGKLEKQQQGWKLVVEPHAIDILLGQIPWNISTVLLPFGNEIVFVEWA